LLTEAHGIPLAVVIDGANRHDMKLVKPTLALPQELCLDKGYDSEDVHALVAELGFTAHIRARGEEAIAIKQEAGFRVRRWVVERTHSWMNRFRRVLIRWEKLAKTYLGFLHLACAVITWRAIGLLE
jgi:putative transposase